MFCLHDSIRAQPLEGLTGKDGVVISVFSLECLDLVDVVRPSCGAQEELSCGLEYVVGLESRCALCAAACTCISEGQAVVKDAEKHQ